MSMSAAEKLYTDGVEEKEKGNFDISQKKFRKLIEKYSESSFAIHSLKELLAVEELNKENYKDLKVYLLTEKKIQQNKMLKKLAGRLANTCDIKFKNYPQAINWFENVIENPETLEDSVFAIIDLGNIYFLMSKNKSAFIGKHAEYKFESIPKFEKKREELIDLLFKQKTNNDLAENDELIHNKVEMYKKETFKVYPNPASEKTQIEYFVNEPSKVSIRLLDYSGREIKVLVNNYQDKGHYQQSISLTNMKPGIYFYIVDSNSKRIKTEKLIITK